ncbi:N-acetylmuramoyl-L-alanine amidase [Beggiatoa leptomitoformis]|uniref:N-acetylmuramoyl-L-alanine amidase AmiC n=1 Tax=Beggiatoa leptomitoformis TaxID=288004 RepID=A0A2N9YJ12_9GAMM|nr:N-acetylmuramoyl-L-alanine amidase [Beggiatoa leptomitoformis]ALG69326.1 AMIN domain-containing protein [Beggiatoa leptomitoformis]AUI70490.1 AMIN domain-containing protein [Beggiatoa leptomitoformis]
MWNLHKAPIFLFFLLLSPIFTIQAESNQLLGMRLSAENSNNAQVSLDLNSPVRYTLFTLSNPERLVIDLENTTLATTLAGISKNSAIIQGVRSAPRNANDLRVVFDLRMPVRTKSFLLKPAGMIGHRLTIDIYNANASVNATPISPTPNRNLSQAAVITPTQPSTLASQSTRKTTATRTTPIPQTNTRPLPISPLPTRDGKGREIIVAIDAGHGGIDPGAIGNQGTYEKNVVLAIARQLALLVDKEYGMRPILIRDGDYFLKLRERIDLARQYQADLFISIHADAVAEGNNNARGSSVYMLSQRGASSEAALWLAEKENAVDLLGGVSLNDKDELLASVLLDLSQTGTLEASAHAAEQILNGLRQINKTHLSKVQRAGFLVLRSPDIPSVLIETAFISNLEEERKLNDPNYQRQLAQAILQGIRGYFAKYAPPGTLLVQR